MGTQEKPYVRDAVYEDTASLAPRLRAEDVTELYYATGKTPLQVLRKSYELSNKCWAVIYKEKVIALFGVSDAGKVGVPWMLASDELKDIKKSFLRECKDYVARMGEGHDLLTNYVWVGNEIHIQWLKWLGFTFLDPIEYGFAKKPFMQFFMKFR